VDARLVSRREPNWNPATLEEVTHIAITEKFFNTVLEAPVRAPVSAGGGGAVPRNSPEWAEYEANRKADQLDLSLAGGGSGDGRGRKNAGRVGAMGGIEEQQQQQQQQQHGHQHEHEHEHEEERKTSYGLPTEEEIRAVLMRTRAKSGGASASAGGAGGGSVVGMTRKHLEMTLKGNRPAIKLGLEERLDEIIARKGLGVQGRDWLVWRDE
jgi:hypothetical protein